jgi:transcriptional regulator with XRE-family HTH domain
MLPSAVTKIEQGTRRVDADDLVALALALGVTPNRLLLPDMETAVSEDERGTELTPGKIVLWREAWAWALGEEPLDVGDGRATSAFRRENRPHLPDRQTLWLFELGPYALAVQVDYSQERADESGQEMGAAFVRLLDLARPTFEQLQTAAESEG